MELTKLCPRCKTTKPLDDFYLCPKSPIGRLSYCKLCDKEYKYTKMLCDCGKQYTRTHKLRHLKSNYHKKHLIF